MMDINLQAWAEKIVPAEELNSRLHRFRAAMDVAHPDWETALFISKVNQYYFTGTMQDGMLLVPRDREAVYWVYRSFERAVAESRFPVIKPMRSYREAAAASGNLGKTVYMETEVIPVALFWRLQKYFPFEEMKALDREVAMVRAVKSPYELARLQQAGEVHRRVLEERVPELLKEGMSEAELAAKLYAVMVEEGHHGLVRFRAFDTDMAIGYIGFGESSIYPTNFNGPGEPRFSPGAPVLGSRERRLKRAIWSLLMLAAGGRLPYRQDHDLCLWRLPAQGSCGRPQPLRGDAERYRRAPETGAVPAEFTGELWIG